MIPSNPDAKLSRTALADALTEAGYDITAATLAGLAHRGGGPDYDLFNGRARYTWGTSLKWAESRVKAPRCRAGAHRASAQAA